MHFQPIDLPRYGAKVKVGFLGLRPRHSSKVLTVWYGPIVTKVERSGPQHAAVHPGPAFSPQREFEFIVACARSAGNAASA